MLSIYFRLCTPEHLNIVLILLTDKRSICTHTYSSSGFVNNNFNLIFFKYQLLLSKGWLKCSASKFVYFQNISYQFLWTGFNRHVFFGVVFFLVFLVEEILNGKLHFLCSASFDMALDHYEGIGQRRIQTSNSTLAKLYESSDQLVFLRYISCHGKERSCSWSC